MTYKPKDRFSAPSPDTHTRHKMVKQRQNNYNKDSNSKKRRTESTQQLLAHGNPNSESRDPRYGRCHQCKNRDILFMSHKFSGKKIFVVIVLCGQWFHYRRFHLLQCSSWPNLKSGSTPPFEVMPLLKPAFCSKMVAISCSNSQKVKEFSVKSYGFLGNAILISGMKREMIQITSKCDN